MKKHVRGMVIGILMLFVLCVTLSACGGGNSLDGYWTSSYWGNVIEFSGKSYKVWYSDFDYKTGMANKTGTFSLTNGKIEMIDSDGKIWVESFSRTENTIEIDGYQYVRINN